MSLQGCFPKKPKNPENGSAQKTGTHYDLAIAVSLLQANEILAPDLEKTVYFGELNLHGQVKWIRGLLPMVIQALKDDYQKIFVPEDNIPELSYLETNSIIPIKSLEDLFNEGMLKQGSIERKKHMGFKNPTAIDYRSILGQKALIDAFLIAAAGNHHMLVIGSPGSGKTMAASRLGGIMPALSEEEILEINMIYSVFSQTGKREWLEERPFRAPHNSASSRALIGGGPKLLPGEVSLAHKGILFLDEFLEFRSDALQALRTVIEKKQAYISMRNGTSCFPADFLLIAAANPCPCGYYATKSGLCSCSLREIKHYRRKLHNPLTDRIDLQVKVDRVSYTELNSEQHNPSSHELKTKVLKAREQQKQRFKKEQFKLNSAIPAEKINIYCPLNESGKKIIAKYVEDNLLSVRAYHKLLKTARTIADCSESETINNEHVLKAIDLRFTE